MSFPHAEDDGLTTPQSTPALYDDALTTPHGPESEANLTEPQEPLAVSVWPMTSPYTPDGPPLAPPPPLRARRGVVRAGVTAVSALALLAVMGGVAFVATHRAGGVAGVNDSAATTAGSYCRAVQGANYAQGYALWDAALTASLASADYVALGKDLDAQAGTVSGCVVGKATTSGTTATVPVTLTRQTAGAQTLTWHLSRGAAGWRISEYPEPSLAARATLRRYCAAVVGGQYGAAYALLAPTVQGHLGSSDTYASVAGEVDAAAGKANGCTTTGVDTAADGTATGHLTLSRNAGDDETVTLAAATTGMAAITASPDVSLLSRITARTFCAALVKKDYNTAFAQFTPSAQAAIGSASAFGDSVGTATRLTGDISGCHAGDFALNADNQSGTLSGKVTTHAFYGDLTHGTVLTMVATAPDAWLIDDATIDGQSLSNGGGIFGGAIAPGYTATNALAQRGNAASDEGHAQIISQGWVNHRAKNALRIGGQGVGHARRHRRHLG